MQNNRPGNGVNYTPKMLGCIIGTTSSGHTVKISVHNFTSNLMATDLPIILAQPFNWFKSYVLLDCPKTNFSNNS